MLFRASAFLLLSVATVPCQAYSTNFEDLVQSTQYAIGSSFASGGIRFNVLPLPSNFPLRIAANNYAGGGGKELWMPSGVGVAVAIPPAASEVTFKYGHYHSQSRLTVNGASTPPNTSVRSANGLVLGGVSVGVTNTPAKSYGLVTLTGAVQSLTVGGVEFALDDLAITAPAVHPDFDGDNDVDGSDFLQWQRGLATAGAGRANGDADGDADVDGDDLAAWRFGYSSPVASIASTVPEPATLTLVGISLLTFCSRRR